MAHARNTAGMRFIRLEEIVFEKARLKVLDDWKRLMEKADG